MEPPLSPIVPRPVMYQDWRELTFLHWRYPASDVQALLPAGLTAQTFDSHAWIGLVPFRMDRVRAPGVPSLPWLSRFAETNVRTYVTAPDGTEGIWFLSLDAARLPAVVAARTTYRLPYFWASMSVRSSPSSFAYGSVRRPGGAALSAVVRRGDEISPGPLDYFLTYRFRLYSVIRGRLVTAPAAHGPWPLCTGSVESLSETLLVAGGLPAPVGPPLVHTSSGVTVRIGGWRSVPR